MPHSSDDLPSVPPAESVENNTPGASAPNPLSEAVPSSGNPAGPAPQEGERRHRRRRRRRRPSPPAATELVATVTREAPTGETVAAGDAAVAASPGAPSGAEGSLKPPPRRWPRRRRGPPRQTGTRPAPAAGDDQAGKEISAGEAAESTGAEDLALQAAPSVPGADMRSSEHRRPRRRRRRPVRDGSSAGPQEGGESRSGSEAVVQVTSRSEPGTVRSLRIGRPRNRRPREAGPQPEQRDPGLRQQRGTRDGEPGVMRRREPDRRGRTPRSRGADGRNARGRQAGRGRDAPPKKPEQKLYALEAVVDRGFEDVTDEADETATRRVHWTIIKRTVADQKSGKPMSATYVLQREGVEAQFPNLGAARAAVNKTIIHPEKLTVSKAEHAAERAAAKK
jgi:hypothetical protein